MTFEEYLISKKIDLKAFQQNENDLFETWKSEFAQMHPHSFTAQKLYLINPLRRKYTLYEVPKEKKIADAVKPTVTLIKPAIDPEDSEQAAVQSTNASDQTTVIPAQPAKPARPVFKPKPKIS
jgi:hypothetical protein